MSIKAQAQSLRERLSNLSNSSGNPYQNLATEFLIERMLARLLSDATLTKALVFKGGYVGLRVYDSPRYTVDLDAIARNADVRKILDRAKTVIESDLEDAVWFKFQEEVDLQTQGEYGGVRLTYRGGIGEPIKKVEKAQILNFDLGIGDPVTPAPVKATTRTIFADEELSWFVYPVETIIAEKLHALVARRDANSRSKDVFDLAHYLPKADPSKIKVALKATFEFRSTPLPENLVEDLRGIDLRVLRVGWAKAIASTKTTQSCDEAFAAVLKILSEKLTR